MTYDDLDARDQALFDEAGGSDGTFVSARMVRALQGNGNAAIFLAQLMWWSKRKADEDGWFFRTRDAMQSKSGLGKSAQKSAEKLLLGKDMIEKERRGLPAKNHYRLNHNLILSALAGDQQDRGVKGANKSEGQGARTGSGGKPAISNYESNKESNTESEARAREDDHPAVKVFIDEVGRRPHGTEMAEIPEVVGTSDKRLAVFRKQCRMAVRNAGTPESVKWGYLLEDFESAVEEASPQSNGIGLSEESDEWF